MSAIKEALTEAMKAAMKRRERARLTTIRRALAEIQREQMDIGSAPDDAQVLVLLSKMVKQCRDSAQQYREGGHEEQAEAEQQEVLVLQEFLPEQLGEAALAALIDAAIASTGAQSPKDMGALMGVLKPQVTGRTDMGKLAALVKARLGQ